MKTLPLLSGVILATALFVTGCHQPAEPTTSSSSLPSLDVRVQPAQSRTNQNTEAVVGTVRARLHANIAAKVSGRIARMNVVEGQRVKTGDVLVQLDVREINAQLAQAQARLQQADSDLHRFEGLRKQQAVTPAEFDAVQARQRVAQAAVEEAQTMLGYATIRAPFDGTITHKLADVGDLATPGRPLIEMENPSSLRFEADVPEAMIDQIQLHAKLPVVISGVSGPLEGTVAEIAPAADPYSRTYRVKLDLPPTPSLRAGQFGRVAVPVPAGPELWVPASAVVRHGQMEQVFVATNHVAQMRLVRTGRHLGNQVELLSGVNAGELVVTQNAGELVDGQPITIKP